MDLVSEAIEHYASTHTTVESPLLKELVCETYENADCPQMQVGHLEGAFLRFLARTVRAKRILEIGTFTGYSTLVMAEALQEDGELITCDRDPEATQIAKRYWDQSPHGKKIHLKLGPALGTLKDLEGPWDMVFIDADKENYISYWEKVIPQVKPGGIVVVDNVLWSGRVLNPREKSDHAIHAFNEHAMKDGRVELAMLTVRDGMTVAWKR